MSGAVRAMPDVPITPALVAEHGLSADEYARIERVMGRAPNLTELGVFSAMWNEHCSYKSSRVWLRTLPTEAPWVICGPGENAGVVDIGDGQAAVFKMESHNHPSFIEPYQGAATGVGGILRDVFTMGARPVASLDALRFGAPGHPKTRHLVAGVVAGIGGYGNCIGVPTVGGSCAFDPAYDGNNLVNAMTVGVAPADRIFYAAAENAVGNPVVYVGAKTGRDGIHGATMASAAFGEGTEEKRPTVQVGDPFTEKLLMEACLALMGTDAIVAIQDMGAAGLTCSSVEMADKGNAGIELDLDEVPVRESAMTPYEIMLSESQERMLMVIRPEAAEEARAVFETWGVDFAVVGRVTDTGRLVLKAGAAVVGDLPVRPLVDQAPVYERRLRADAQARAPGRHRRPRQSAAGTDGGAATAPRRARPLLQALDMGAVRPHGDGRHGAAAGRRRRRGARPRHSQGPGADGRLHAALLRRRSGLGRGAGGGGGVAQPHPRSARGRWPSPTASTSAIPSGRRSWASSSGCIEGMAEACRALDFPVVSGNVSFHNETERYRHPAHAVHRRPRPDRRSGPHVRCRPSRRRTRRCCWWAAPAVHLARSLYQREIEGREEGPPPAVDLAAERRHGDFVRPPDRERDGSPPATTSRTAACWWRSPRWRWPPSTRAAPSAPGSPCRQACLSAGPAGSSARIRRATC